MSSTEETTETQDETTGVMDFFGSGNASTLQTFAASPAAFIFGVILTPLLNGLETVVAKTLDLVYLVFFGTLRTTTDGQLGIADVPLVVADLLIDVGDLIGQPILSVAIRPLSKALVGFADWAGPLGFLGAALALVIIVNVYASALRTAIEVVLDFIPGGGALIN